MATFSSLIVDYFFFQNPYIQVINDINNMLVSQKSVNRCRLYRINKKYKSATENDYFSLTKHPIFFFFKINRVQANDDTDKLCKFHKILTTNSDCIT